MMITKTKGKPWVLWAGLVLLASFIALVFFLKLNSTPSEPKTGLPEFQKLVLSQGFDFNKYSKEFEKVCPSIDTCFIDDISGFVRKCLNNGVPPEQIPRINEIESLVLEKLSLQKENPFTPLNFWENFHTLLTATGLNLLSAQEKEEWALRLAKADSAEFCPKLYEMEPNKAGPLNSCCKIPVSNREQYEALCHIRWVQTVGMMVYSITNTSPSVDYFSNKVQDYEALKARLCRNISNSSQYFRILSGWGAAYLSTHVFCNQPIPDADIERIQTEHKENPDNVAATHYYNQFKRFI